MKGGKKPSIILCTVFIKKIQARINPARGLLLCERCTHLQDVKDAN